MRIALLILSLVFTLESNAQQVIQQTTLWESGKSRFYDSGEGHFFMSFQNERYSSIVDVGIISFWDSSQVDTFIVKLNYIMNAEVEKDQRIEYRGISGYTLVKYDFSTSITVRSRDDKYSRLSTADINAITEAWRDEED